MGQVTVFSGPERRRRWSDEERLQVLSRGVCAGVSGLPMFAAAMISPQG